MHPLGFVALSFFCLDVLASKHGRACRNKSFHVYATASQSQSGPYEYLQDSHEHGSWDGEVSGAAHEAPSTFGHSAPHASSALKAPVSPSLSDDNYDSGSRTSAMQAMSTSDAKAIYTTRYMSSVSFSEVTFVSGSQDIHGSQSSSGSTMIAASVSSSRRTSDISSSHSFSQRLSTSGLASGSQSTYRASEISSSPSSTASAMSISSSSSQTASTSAVSTTYSTSSSQGAIVDISIRVASSSQPWSSFSSQLSPIQSSSISQSRSCSFISTVRSGSCTTTVLETSTVSVVPSAIINTVLVTITSTSVAPELLITSTCTLVETSIQSTTIFTTILETTTTALSAVRQQSQLPQVLSQFRHRYLGRLTEELEGSHL